MIEDCRRWGWPNARRTPHFYFRFLSLRNVDAADSMTFMMQITAEARGQGNKERRKG